MMPRQASFWQVIPMPRLNTNLKTGGYEQNRANKSTFVFSKNPYCWYANSLNAFLNLGLRF